MAFRFLPQETAAMEARLEERNFLTPPKSEIYEIADRFSRARVQIGHKPIVWKQVWNWFQNKRHNLRNRAIKAQRDPGGSEPLNIAGDVQQQTTKFPGQPPPSGPAATLGKGSVLLGNAQSGYEMPPNMEFEARSSREGAWYDVEACSGQRTNEQGETFAGFTEEECEWVNAKTSIRQRSLPCEANECVCILPKDLVLCFQEANEQALYFDAEVLDVQRRRHDVRGCRCRFWVRYRHDGGEEIVPLRKICRRPETEIRLQAAQQAQAAFFFSGKPVASPAVPPPTASPAAPPHSPSLLALGPPSALASSVPPPSPAPPVPSPLPPTTHPPFLQPQLQAPMPLSSSARSFPVPSYVPAAAVPQPLLPAASLPSPTPPALQTGANELTLGGVNGPSPAFLSGPSAVGERTPGQ
eukprot:TRINITY_DN19301_c0_g1_i1.p1 TRINITY_DN19301_c0_g1~~TRINITY_DN19301_c0_g1_i1.p1  ORF type:complete len:411 (+),score=56.58 TRINITY_DN19301_c0_g1_i1:235-1467(+)